MRATIRITTGLLLASAMTLVGTRAFAADPTTADCLGASESALKLRTDHKLREARAQLLVCSASMCPSDIRTECERHVSDVNAAIPTIVFEPKDAAGNDLTGVKVTMDGALLVERLEGSAISLDPGEHTFTFEVAGQPPLQKTLILHEAEKDRRERVVMGSAAPPGALEAPQVTAPDSSPGTTPPATPAPPDSAAPADASGGAHSNQKTWAAVFAGAGIVALGVGTAFAVEAKSSWTNSQAECSLAGCPQHAQSVADYNSASSQATIATVGFGVGIAGLIAGVVVWATAPSSAKTAARGVLVLPAVGDRSGGAVLSGRF